MQREISILQEEFLKSAIVTSQNQEISGNAGNVKIATREMMTMKENSGNVTTYCVRHAISNMIWDEAVDLIEKN